MALLLLVLFALCSAAPRPQHFPVFRVFVAQPAYLGYSPVTAPQTRLPTPAPLTTLVHNSISYRVDADAQPDDALEVAQFHSQDAAGRVVFGFNTPDQTRMEARALDGSVRGSYSYQDPTGKIVKMHYWDDGMGFHTVGNNLPSAYYSPPEYTPEVQAARAQHFSLYRQALAAALASGGGYLYEPPADQFPGNADSAVSPSVDPQPETPQTPAAPVASEDPPADQANDVVKSEAVEDDADNDSVAIENLDFSYRMSSSQPQFAASAAPSATPQHMRTDPEANRRQVAQVSDLTLGPSPVAIARTGANGYQYLYPVAAPLPGQSESLYAVRYGAIPVSAVHDTQVSPAQKENIDNFQVKPVLLRTGLETA